MLSFDLISIDMSYTALQSVNYAIFSYLNLQLITYTAYRSLLKITNLMVRHLTRSHFLESFGTRYYFDAALSPSKRHNLESKLQKSY